MRDVSLLELHAQAVAMGSVKEQGGAPVTYNDDGSSVVHLPDGTTIQQAPGVAEAIAEKTRDAFIETPGPYATFNGWVIKKAAAADIVMDFGVFLLVGLVGLIILTRQAGRWATAIGIVALALGCAGMGAVIGDLPVPREFFFDTIVRHWSEYPLDAQLAMAVMILATVGTVILLVRRGFPSRT